MFTLPKLSYPLNALKPYLSEETLQYHHGKHHQTYVDKLNTLVQGTPLESKPLEELIKTVSGNIFNNAAQIWNHTFYFNGLIPAAAFQQPSNCILDLIRKNFDSLENFKAKFTEQAINTFGSGWTWLIQDTQGRLEVISTSNADNPLKLNKKPLLTCDVWEHAYYIDYRNARVKYLEAFWSIINWNFVEKNCLA